jgi:hypothetical protein
MPLPAALIPFIPLIAAGVGAGGTAFGAWRSGKSQQQINDQNARLSKDMMHQQRQWALEDWDKVNAYNHPSQQMARYKEAGLNPNLIYGSASNSPATMVRSTNQEAPKMDARGFIDSAQQMGQIGPQMLNSYFAAQQMENQTALAQAQILKLKADTDRSEQQFKLTGQQWDELVKGPMFQNLRSANLMEYTDTLRNAQPTQKMAWERYTAETAKTNAQAAHALELFKLADKENLLKQADIDMLEKFSTGKMGWQSAIDFLKFIIRMGFRR